MREPEDVLAFVLYEQHKKQRHIMTNWNNLSSGEKNHWRKLASVAIAWCEEMLEIYQETG
jgi:hypothetical protein